MEIKILGSGGCKACKLLEETVRQVVSQMGVVASVTKIEDISTIMSYGVLSTPGLVVNGRLRAFGRVLREAEIRKIIEEEVKNVKKIH